MRCLPHNSLIWKRGDRLQPDPLRLVEAGFVAVVHCPRSDTGGKRAACIYTILETARMCGINPQAYLADVLNRIADHPIRQIDATQT
jgi:transposase